MRQPERMRVTATVLLAVWLHAFPASAAQQSMYFRHLSLEEGLSQNTVTSILQDTQGFIWLGTESGLNRYDGYSVARFNRDVSRAGGLPSDYVWALAEDARGFIWIGTGNGGVARWNPRSERFATFRHDPDRPESLADDAVRTLVVDHEGFVWVGLSESGLDRLDPTTGTAVHFRHDPGDPESLPSDAVFALHPDRSGGLWIGTDAGISRLDPQTGRFTRYRLKASDTAAVSSARVRVIHQDHDGALWVGTFGDGITLLEPGNGAFRRFTHDPDDSQSVSHDHIRAIFRDDAQRLWVGTANGLNVLERSTMRFRRFYKEQRPESLNDNYIMSIYQDRGGLLWIGTRSGGANLWNPRSWSLGHYQGPWLQNTYVTGFASDGDRLWVGTYDNGITELADGIPVGHVTAPALSDDRVMTLLYAESGVLWVGTMGAGLDRHDLTTGTTVNYRNDPQRPGSLSANGVMSLLKDRSGTLWVGTFGGGLNRFDPATGTFTTFAENEGLSNSRATSISEDSNGNIWVGTEAGLNRLDPRTGEIVQYHHDRRDPHSLSADAVFSLHVDSSGGLWVGTSEGGLSYLANPAGRNARFENLTQLDGLPSNLIYGIRSDARGHLWLSTKTGLARLDPESRQIKVFRKSHGLQGDEFNFGAHYRDERGRLYFGGANGFNAIAPELLEEGRHPPRVVITGIHKMNKPAQTSVPYSLLERLDVAYDETVVTFEFAALDFTSPSQNRFAYRLDGFDSDWNHLEGGHRATYTNLDAGDYVFRVKAANSEGVWSEAAVTLPVVVQPAPWLTAWAYTGYAACALAVALALLRQQAGKRRREASYRRQLQHLAFVDQLTGIANRQLFTRRLRTAIAEASRDGTEMALLYVDLDDFKRINDTLGHGSGDEILKQVAKRLHAVLRRVDQTYPRLETDIARLGGDEFVLLVRGMKGARLAELLARQTLDSLRRPFRHRGRELVVTPSIGISVYPRDGASAEPLMKNADTAMYEAKNAGRNEYRFFVPEMSERADEHLALESALRQAIVTDQLWVAYQPKVDLRTMSVVGAEALVRWRHPLEGDKSPAEFIPVAERSGLIYELDQWVVGQVSAQLGEWLSAGYRVLPVAVNLSGREFGNAGLANWLCREIEAAGIPSRYLEVEVTEGVLMNNYEVARSVLSRLTSLGFKVSIDDFGTGYSSLAYLKNFPLSTLKIDQSFIADLEQSDEDRAICTAIISMARGLKLTVVAEGVETDRQLEFLVAHGCDQAQGFGLHRPMPADRFAALLAEASAGAGADDAVPPSLLRDPDVHGRARA